MMKFFISYLLVFTLIFPAYLYADPPPDNPSPPTPTPEVSVNPAPKIMGIRKGQAAPFSGVLLNSLAAARIFADKDFSNEECELKIEYELNLIAAQHQLELDKYQIQFDGLQERYDAMNLIKDDEITRLQDLIGKHPNRRNAWMFAGGVVAGVATSISIMYATAELTN